MRRQVSSRTLLDTLLSAVDERRTQALYRMEAEVGSTGLCTISRAGHSVPALKYDEGAASALADLRRALRYAEPDVDEATLLAAIAEVRETWRHAPAHRLAHASRDWQAYATGGEDALSALLDATSW